MNKAAARKSTSVTDKIAPVLLPSAKRLAIAQQTRGSWKRSKKESSQVLKILRKDFDRTR